MRGRAFGGAGCSLRGASARPSGRSGRLFCACMFAALLLGAEIVDRIAASVGMHVITESEVEEELRVTAFLDRKSTRLNSSHSQISYAVFCLKKKKKSKN